MVDVQPHLFCFGLGYCGSALAQQLVRSGWRVTGTSRTPGDNAGHMDSVSVLPFSGSSGEWPQVMSALSTATHILSTVSTDETGDPVINVFGTHLAKLEAVNWVGYLSTTGVYGNTDGAEIDEDHPVNPSGSRGERRVAAERQWLELGHQSKLPVHIFRLPGIYGPGRSVFDQIRQGKARQVHKPGHRFNRVHVDDITQTLRASMEQPNPGRVYNVCDNLPIEPSEVTLYACMKMGIEPPTLLPFDEARQDMSAMGLSFWQDHRRVSNARVKSELGVTLRYPDYKSGLDAIWQEERGQN